uniref:Uncharacterized protein n=1 Tax=Melopsittacus undulatus TaxID=13146 RepID=A0A8V5GJT4_MELUD
MSLCWEHQNRTQYRQCVCAPILTALPGAQLRCPSGWLRTGLVPGDPGGAAGALCRRLRWGRSRNAAVLGGSCSRGAHPLTPAQSRDHTMELLRLLLALAGTGTALGLGDCCRGCRGSLWTFAPGGLGMLLGMLLGLLLGLWDGVSAHSVPAPAALLPYVPHVPTVALPGKLTATTFTLERPNCIFEQEAEAPDAVWLVVAFANASGSFRNPLSRADVPLYEQLPTAHSYMTLETPVRAFTCSAPSPAPLRVGGDTACGGQEPCNGPLPSPGPYRVKFLVMGCHGPRAETRWSEPILLQRASSLSTIDPLPVHRSSTVVVITSILASLGAVLAAAVLSAVGYGSGWGHSHGDPGGHPVLGPISREMGLTLMYWNWGLP